MTEAGMCSTDLIQYYNCKYISKNLDLTIVRFARMISIVAVHIYDTVLLHRLNFGGFFMLNVIVMEKIAK